ncbi:FadR/GntR family transcriptional regulator [Nocardia panacis]|uniref:FadR/GntR family transcriptional regulator n=1 Tax=Nocardia panacis TaxID=2340916 RepID=UPI0013158EFB|nr:FadR/GntR family transcriptional regulator [Nocardia panacis]
MRQKLSDGIVDDILGKIGSGELPEGSVLPAEAALAAQYGVGRSVMREALRGLAAKGFLVSRQGSTTTVAPRTQWSVLDPDFLAANSGAAFYEELQEARELLEPLITRLAATRRPPELIDTLQRLHSEMISAGADPEQHAELDVRFHETLATATGNTVLVSMHNSISNMGHRTRAASAAIPGAVERAIHWHHQILETVAAGDPDTAEAAMRMHLRQVRGELSAVQTAARIPEEPRQKKGTQ